MKKIFTLLTFLLILICNQLYSQDTIRTKKDTIIGKVSEIGIDEIKYYDARLVNGPLMVIPKMDVIEIRYANGSRFMISPDPYDINEITTVRNKTHSIKFEFFSPLTNDIAFGYETMLKVGTNLEFKVGIIGPGFHQEANPASGVFLKGGVKFLIRPQYIIKGVKYAHALHGSYLKPEIIFNTYSREENVVVSYNGTYGNAIYEDRNIQNTNFCINLVYGKQLILGSSVTFDYYFGLGYGIHSDNREKNLYYSDYSSGEEYAYSHLYFGSDFPMIITGGITLGVLF